MLPGQILPGQMLLGHLSTVKDGLTFDVWPQFSLKLPLQCLAWIVALPCADKNTTTG